MKGLIDSCAHLYVEFGRVLSFELQLQLSLELNSKKDERFNESAETLLSVGKFEERG